MPTTKDLKDELADLVEQSDESAWSLSESLGRDGKWIGRKIKGERQTYLSDVYALRYYLNKQQN
jgi:hypothetical protein